jgi:hypothetical protein
MYIYECRPKQDPSKHMRRQVSEPVISRAGSEGAWLYVSI